MWTKGISTIDIHKHGSPSLPILDNFETVGTSYCQAFSAIVLPVLYPKADLLSIWQHKQVANRRDGGLAIQESLGSL